MRRPGVSGNRIAPPRVQLSVELTAGLPGAECGVYSYEELEALGMGLAAREAAVRDGTLIRLRRRWYAAPGHNPEVARAVLAGGTLGCVSALSKHGLWVPPGYPELHVRRPRPEPGGHSCRGYTRMRAGETAVDSLVIALECAARCMSDEDWIAVCDSAQNIHGVSAETLRGLMSRLPKRVLELFAKTDGRSQSGTESIVRVRLRALGFDVVVQPEIPGVGHPDLRLGRLILECDGRLYHSSAEEFQNDRTRDRKALIGGYISMRLTYDDVLYDWPATLEDIRAVTRRRRHRIRGPLPHLAR